MALPIVFDNVTYGVNFLSQDNDGVQSAVFENNGNNDVPYVFNGTISSVGDPVTLTNTSTNAQFDLYATNLDNANQIVFSENPDGSGFAILVSNTQLIEGQTETFSENTLGDFTPVCFTTGTRIRTERGEIAVEDLQIGDLAVTASGAQHPIRWIGHRTISCIRHPDPAHVQPVRIAAGALGENKPERDLLVSPGHAICLDILGQVLIPASALVNGTTITQEQVEEVTYWHVELDSHDILIANGQPAESYLDMGNRAFFAESGVVDLSALPDASPAARTHADFCRPFHDGGPLVDAVRAQLRRRAEMQGWSLEQTDTWAGVHLEVDGRIVEPKVRGLSACFEVPADAQDVCLVSPTSVPRHVSDNPDNRALGLSLTGLRLDDGLNEARVVALDDALLDEGFHAVASDHRWTAGRARLPAALFAGLEGTAFLRVELGAPALPRWATSEAAVETSEQRPEGLRLVKAA